MATFFRTVSSPFGEGETSWWLNHPLEIFPKVRDENEQESWKPPPSETMTLWNYAAIQELLPESIVSKFQLADLMRLANLKLVGPSKVMSVICRLLNWWDGVILDIPYFYLNSGIFWRIPTLSQKKTKC